MSVFRRRRRAEPDDAQQPDAQQSEDGSVGTDVGEDTTQVGASTSGPGPSTANGPGRENGPWDISEVDDPAAGGRVDLGGMWLPGRPGLEVRIEADQATSQVVAVTLVLPEGALQVQPFAAPRTESIWDEVRDEIRAGITKQGGTSDEVTGPLGTELRTRVPVRAQDGSSSVQPARFVGVDGPRWFLRGVLTGRVAVEEGAGAELIDVFRDIVVVRGEAAMAPRDPIPLALPPSPAQPDDPDDALDEAGAGTGDDGPDDTDPKARTQADLKPFERGPEITEIH